MVEISSSMSGGHGLRQQRVRNRVTRKHWMQWIEKEIGLTPGDPGFDAKFAAVLAEMMRDCGYPHVAAGILGAGADAEREAADRTEFDGLVDLALNLVVLDTEA